MISAPDLLEAFTEEISGRFQVESEGGRMCPLWSKRIEFMARKVEKGFFGMSFHDEMFAVPLAILVLPTTFEFPFIVAMLFNFLLSAGCSCR